MIRDVSSTALKSSGFRITPLPMRIGYETTSALSGAIIPHPLHVKASEQSRSCRPSCLWKHWLSWGETVASCLEAQRSSVIVLYSWRAVDSQNLTSCLPCMPHHCCVLPEKRDPVFWKCELSLPPVSPFDDSLGADSLTLRVLRVVGVGSWGRV